MEIRYLLIGILVPVVSIVILTLSVLWFKSSRLMQNHEVSNSPITIPTTTVEDESALPTVLMKTFVNESPIKSAVDPYLEGVISVGQIVVVIKPYYLPPTNIIQPGDLLRLTKIYRHDDDDHRAGYPDNNACIDRNDALYKELSCTGILLSNYLEFEPKTNSMQMKDRNIIEEGNLERNFPLEAVSLERTLLYHIDNQSPLLL